MQYLLGLFTQPQRYSSRVGEVIFLIRDPLQEIYFVLVTFQFTFELYGFGTSLKLSSKNELPRAFVLGPFVSVLVVSEDTVLEVIGLADVELGCGLGLDDVGEEGHGVGFIKCVHFCVNE